MRALGSSRPLARDDEATFVRQWFDAFAGNLERIGVPRRLTRRVACWPAFAVTMRVEHVFDQTPGPKAGSRVRCPSASRTSSAAFRGSPQA